MGRSAGNPASTFASRQWYTYVANCKPRYARIDWLRAMVSVVLLLLLITASQEEGSRKSKARLRSESPALARHRMRAFCPCVSLYSLHEARVCVKEDLVRRGEGGRACRLHHEVCRAKRKRDTVRALARGEKQRYLGEDLGTDLPSMQHVPK